MTQLDYSERDVLKNIIAYGGPNLSRNLEMWGEWLKDRESERSHLSKSPYTSSFPIVLLSQMGIYGAAALEVKG
jgi:hypothetical protein